MNNFYRKIIAITATLTAFMMFFTASFAPSFAIETGSGGIGTVTNANTITAAPGMDYSLLSMTAGNDRSERVYILELKPNSNVRPIIGYGSQVIGMNTLSGLIDRERGNGHDVFAGINSDFYNMSTGMPIGIMIKNGIFISSASGYNGIGFFSDGTAIIEKPQIRITAEYGANRNKFDILQLNKDYSPDGIYLYNRDFAATTRTNKPAVEILARIDNGMFKIGTSINATVVAVGREVTSTSIPDSSYIVISAECNTSHSEKIKYMNIGDNITINITPVNPLWSSVVEAIGGKDILVTNGQVNSGITSAVQPNTAIGVRPNGEVVAIVVDGRTQISAGVTTTELANEFVRQGCYTAMLMDGGGSSTMSVRKHGDEKAKIVNVPSDGRERSISNALLFVNTAPRSSTPHSIYITPEETALNADSSVKFNIHGMDENYRYMPSVDNIYYTLDREDLGTVSADGTFTSYSMPGMVALTARSYTDPSITVSSKITIVDQVDEITSNVKEFIARPGERIQITPYFVRGNEITEAPIELISFEVTNFVGTVDANGIFTVSSNRGSTGSVILTYKDSSYTIPVTVIDDGYYPDGYGNFESSAFGYALITSDNTASGKMEFTGASTAFRGNKALKLTYDLGEDTAESSDEINDAYSYVSLAPNVNLTGPNGEYTGSVLPNGANAIEIWLGGDKLENNIYAEISDGMGTIEKLPLLPLSIPAVNGYTCYTADIPSYIANPVLISAFTVEKGAITSTGIVYIDAIRIITNNEPEDRTAPKIAVASNSNGNSNIMPFTVTDNPGGANEFTSGVNPNSIRATVDGKTAAFTYDKSTGIMSLEIDPMMSDGRHRITIQAADNKGNKISWQYGFTSQGRAPAFEYIDTEEHWSKANIELATQYGIVSGSQTAKGTWVFNPNKDITKLEFAKIIALTAKLDIDKYENTELLFEDLDLIAEWGLPYVKAVYGAKLISGSSINGKTYYEPNKPVTRAEVMTVIAKILPSTFSTPKTTLDFKDANLIPPWAASGAVQTVNCKIIGGYEDNTLRPLNNVKRGEIVKIICSFIT